MRAFFFFFYYKIGTPCNSDASGKISNTKKKKEKRKKREKVFGPSLFVYKQFGS